jgi:hypothetical protein
MWTPRQKTDQNRVAAEDYDNGTTRRRISEKNDVTAEKVTKKCVLTGNIASETTHGSE